MHGEGEGEGEGKGKGPGAAKDAGKRPGGGRGGHGPGQGRADDTDIVDDIHAIDFRACHQGCCCRWGCYCCVVVMVGELQDGATKDACTHVHMRALLIV